MSDAWIACTVNGVGPLTIALPDGLTVTAARDSRYTPVVNDLVWVIVGGGDRYLVAGPYLPASLA